MQFFRKYFVLILCVGLGLIALSMVFPLFFEFGNSADNQPVVQQIQTQEPQFKHQANLTVFAKDNQPIQTFEIELAQNPNQTELGLMYRKSMAQNRGMLFIFPQEQERSFWMKNTYIPLDIVYINAEKQIVSIVKNAEPLSEISRPSLFPAQFVLELNGGVCDKLGIEVGDTITFQPL